MLEVPLDRRDRAPLYRQIAQHLSRMIERGTLAPGQKLPSARELASSLGVSRTTANLAYDALEGEGRIRVRGRSGTFVVSRPDGEPLVSGGAPLPQPLDLASGEPSPDLLPDPSHLRFLREGLGEGDLSLFAPSPVPGREALRRALVRHAATRGIPARWEDLVVTSGGQEGLCLAFEALKSLGVRRVFFEELTYPDAPRIARGVGLSACPLPFEEAPLVEALGEAGPGDGVYLVPSFHNPTGRTLSVEARKALLERSAARGFWILEDDTYGELRYGETSVPALKALEGSDRVVYVGSFSQVLLPGWRTGYVLAPEAVLGPLCALKALRVGALSSLVQGLVLRFLEGGGLEDALSRNRGVLSHRMRRLREALRNVLGERAPLLPEGGVFLWLDTAPFSGDKARSLLAARGVLVVSGQEFCLRRRTERAVRLCVARLGLRELDEAAGILGILVGR